MTIVAYVPNIFDRSRFEGKHRDQVQFIDDAAELDEIALELVIVDLDRCADPASFTVTGKRSIGFGSHVEAEVLAAATNMGFDEVLPRSRFFRQLPDILADLTSQPRPPTGRLPPDES